MNGIIINIDPVLFRLGVLEIRWYGLAILLALTAAYLVAARGARNRHFPVEEISNLFPWLIVGGLAGARLLHVIDQWDFYVAKPWQALMIQQGGLAVWGGVAGGAAAAIMYTRVKRLSLGLLADIAAPALLVGQIIGRLGCLINGDAYGGQTTLPWGLIYNHPGAMIPRHLLGQSTHPYPIYEMLWNGVALLAILALGRRSLRKGTLFVSYLVFYSLGRLLLSSVRQEEIIFLALQQAQIIALLVLAGAAVYFFFTGRIGGGKPDSMLVKSVRGL